MKIVVKINYSYTRVMLHYGVTGDFAPPTFSFNCANGGGVLFGVFLSNILITRENISFAHNYYRYLHGRLTKLRVKVQNAIQKASSRIRADCGTLRFRGEVDGRGGLSQVRTSNVNQVRDRKLN